MKRGKIYRREKKNLQLFSGFKDIRKKVRSFQIETPEFNSEFKKSLRNIQVIKTIYCIRDRQFKNYFKNKKINNLKMTDVFEILELRLDNILYRSNISLTRKSARKTIVHKNIFVNSKTVNSPSFKLKPGDLIKIKKINKNIILSLNFKKNNVSWIKKNNDSWKILRYPKIDDYVDELNEY
ncbi:S4 domain-containing protein [Candidatus Vidania fulgoroideorum]